MSCASADGTVWLEDRSADTAGGKIRILRGPKFGSRVVLGDATLLEGSEAGVFSFTSILSVSYDRTWVLLSASENGVACPYLYRVIEIDRAKGVHSMTEEFGNCNEVADHKWWKGDLGVPTNPYPFQGRWFIGIPDVKNPNRLVWWMYYEGKTEKGVEPPVGLVET